MYNSYNRYNLNLYIYIHTRVCVIVIIFNCTVHMHLLYTKKKAIMHNFKNET